MKGVHKKLKNLPKWFVSHCKKWNMYSYNNLFRYWHGVGLMEPDLVKIHNSFMLDKNTVAVVGSVGKSTAVRILSELLTKAGYYNYSTRVNDNWLPKISLAAYLSLRKHYSVRIFECATIKKGDIRALSFLIPADFILLTEITNAHLAVLKDPLGVIKEKLSFFYNCNGAVTVSHINNKPHLVKRGIKATYYGENGSGADYLFSNIKTNLNKTTFSLKRSKGKDIKVEIAGFGRHLACETAGVVAMFERIVGRPIKEGEIKILKKHETPYKRMELVKDKNVYFIIDTANANRLSIMNSLESFLEVENSRPKGLILGHFSGMGESLQSEVDYISKRIIKLSLKKLSFMYLIGEEFENLYKEVKQKSIKARLFSNLQDVLKNIDLKKLNGHIVLMRGPSHGKENLVLLLPKYRNRSDETYYLRK